MTTVLSISQEFDSKKTGNQFDHKDISKEFDQAKRTYFKIAGAVGGVSLAGLALGSARYGAGFPARVLRTVGDAFGAVAALFVPFLVGKNEVNEYNRLKHGIAKGTGAEQHSINELLYRSVSIGFLPYIFGSLIDPEKIGTSRAQQFAAIANIPNLIFTGITFGFGSFNSIIAWLLRAKEQFKFDTQQTELEKLKNNSFGLIQEEINRKLIKLEETSKRKHYFSQLYLSTKRLVTIGSIALPAMHGLKRFAEAYDSFFKDGSILKECFSKPFTTMSRAINLVIGLPEVIAKSFDSIARVAQEIDHLKPALPNFIVSPVERFSRYFDKQVSSNSVNCLKCTRNLAEIIFHTLSPLSQLAFIAPILDKTNINTASPLDKIISICGRTSLLLTTVPYIFVSRFPQTLAQCFYFGRYYFGKHIKKESDLDIQKAVEATQEKICNFPIIRQVSKIAESITNYILPDYNKCEFPSFIDIQVNYSFAQAQAVFEDKLQAGCVLTQEAREVIVDYCLNYVERSSRKSFQKLTNDELLKIRQKIEIKLEHVLNPEKVIPRKVDIKFPGAYLLSHFLRPFNLVARIRALSTQSPFHRMETAYNIDEIPAFETQEFLIVLSECIATGLYNTVKRILHVLV